MLVTGIGRVVRTGTVGTSATPLAFRLVSVGSFKSLYLDSMGYYQRDSSRLILSIDSIVDLTLRHKRIKNFRPLVYTLL